MKLVKHILFVIIILQGVTGEQFAKFPVLFSHFIEHNQIHSMTFGEFLEHHYLELEHDDDDDERDQSLPFKNTTHTCFQFVPNEPLSVQVILLSVELASNNFTYQEDVYPDPVFDIVHPPSNLI